MTIRRSIECWLFHGGPSPEAAVLLLQVAAKPEHPAYWQPITGGIESGEIEEQACLREAREETGIVLDISRLTRLDEAFTVQIDPALTVHKTLFVATTETRQVQISDEHTGWQWISFRDASAALYWPSSRETYGEVNAFLEDRT